VKRVRIVELETKKAGPLEQTWMERHQKRVGHKCDLIVKKSGWPPIYTCTNCGQEI
jgi:hypothetical protein